MRLSMMRFFQQKNLLLKMVLSYVLIGSILISCFAIVVANKVSANFIQEAQGASEKMIYQSYTTAETLLNSTFNYYYQLFSTDELIFQAMYGNEFTRVEIGKINKKVSELTTTNPLVYSIYIYNFQYDAVFSSMDTTNTIESFYDSDMSKLLEQGELVTKGVFIPRQPKFQILDRKYDKKIISIVFTSSYKNDGSRGVMVINLDQEVLQNLLTKGGSDSMGNVMIVNNDGIAITHFSSDTFNRNLSSSRFIEQILASTEKKMSFTGDVNGTQQLISYVKSDRLGWNFIGIVNNEAIVGKVTLLKRFIWIFMFIFVLLGVIGAGVFTNIFYRPINRLLKRTRGYLVEMKEEKALGEYDLLFQSFSSLESKVKTLQSSADQYMPARKKELLLELLRGEVSVNEHFANRMEILGIQLQSSPYVVIKLRLDGFSRLVEAYSLVDVSLFKYAIANIAGEIFQGHYAIEMVEEGEDSLALLVNKASGQLDQMTEIEALLRHIQTNVEHYLKFTVTISIGVTAQDWQHLRHSWNTASQASNYRLIYGANSLIHYATLHEQEQREYEYPFQEEKAIMEALKYGDMTKLRKSLNDFLDHCKVFVHDEILLSLTQLVLMTMRTAKGMIGSQHEELFLELKDVHQQLNRMETLDYIAQWYSLWCEKMIDIRNQRSNNRNKELVDKMVQYIHEHYMDVNLSVETLVDLVGLSTNYVRKMFKETTDLSISSYITELRFKRAQELLIETDLPANKIGEQVGFMNSSYFYVSFKKFTGKTPEMFRRDFKINPEQ